ncbi:MAG: ABC transporter ATP-binding protein [Clostridia bacterium]
MIEIQNLSKRFGKIQAVKNISFTVNKGEILGFLGPNGAGKTTTMNIITGFIGSTTGSVKVCGFDVLEQPQEVKKRIGYLPEQPPLYFDMTVNEFLRFVCELKSVEHAKIKAMIDTVCELVKITTVRKRLIKNLSKGFKQRVGLAQALVGDPEVLILDEPTVGLDPTQIIEMRKLIRQLSKKHTIILSSHILSEVSAVCDRVVIINHGEIAAVDTPENLSKAMNTTGKFSILVAGPKNSVSNLIRNVNGVRKVEFLMQKGDHFEFAFEIEQGVDARKPIFFELAKAGYPILELKPMGLSLEDIFLSVVNENPVEEEK